MTFEELGLEPNLLKAITDLGFTSPTPIQEKTISTLQKEKTDVVALAQTGTGKTAAFGLPMLSIIDTAKKYPQALILAPTRELCMQITKDLANYAKYMSGVKVTAVYGGARIDAQIRDIKSGSQIIAATPGRLCDLIDRKAIDLSLIQVVVLDEADEMLNMGFKDDLDIILGKTSSGKNTWLFSATMPKEVERIASKYMNSPLEISVGKKNQGAENIEHVYYVVSSRERYAALKRVVDYYPEIFGIVFCRTKAETQEVADHLIKDGYSADALHGDLSQSQRDFVMKRFRNNALQMLVATDVAARGIDVSNITHVINYNLPEDAENYTHRSGRTARAGKSGISISIVTSKETGKIKDLERISQKTFKRSQVPNGVDVCEKQLFNLVKKLHEVEVKDEEIEKFLPIIYEELKDLSKEELIKRFISEEFNRFYTYYQNAPDLNSAGGDAREGGSGRSTRFFINMGMLDGFNRQSLKDFLADVTQQPARMIFNVDCKNSFSFFETESKLVDTFIAVNAKDVEFNNRKVSLEVSNRKMGSGGGDGERKSFSKSSSSEGYGAKKSYGRSEGGSSRGFGNKSSGSSRSYGNKSEGSSRSYGNKSEGSSGERKSFGKPFKSAEKDGNRDEKRPFRRDGGFKKSFGSKD